MLTPTILRHCVAPATVTAVSSFAKVSWLLSLLVASATACAPSVRTVANVTAGGTGCPTNDLTIFDYDEASRTWGAACVDKLFVCASSGGGKCKQRESQTVEPELRDRVALVAQLPKAGRDLFVKVKMLDGDWDTFSRRVAVVQRLNDAQIQELESLQDIYLDLSDGFSGELTACVETGVLPVYVYDSGQATSKVLSPCASALAARLRFARPYRERRLALIAGMRDVKPLPRPEMTQPVADAAEPAPAPAALADEAPIRTWLDEHAEEILACNAGQTVAVRVDLDDQGTAAVGIHGAPAGSPEVSCLQAALTAPAFGQGPGTLIHVVKPSAAP